MSFKPDPDAFALDAFSLNWSTYNFVAFPPFALVSRTLQKIQEDSAAGPILAKSSILPVLMEMLIDNPVILTARINLLQLPSASHRPHHEYVCLQSVRLQYANQGISDEAIDIIMSSRRPKTKKVYATYIISGFMETVVRNGGVNCPPFPPLLI